MNPEPPLHPTSVPTRRKPIPRGRFRERVGLGCVLAYPYVIYVFIFYVFIFYVFIFLEKQFAIGGMAYFDE